MGMGCGLGGGDLHGRGTEFMEGKGEKSEFREKVQNEEDSTFIWEHNIDYFVTNALAGRSVYHR